MHISVDLAFWESLSGTEPHRQFDNKERDARSMKGW
jgi:hypothetical protein